MENVGIQVWRYLYRLADDKCYQYVVGVPVGEIDKFDDFVRSKIAVGATSIARVYLATLENGVSLAPIPVELKKEEK